MSEQVSKNKQNLGMLNGQVAEQPLTRKAAMSKAVEAYIRCEELSIDERKRLITLARVKTSLYRAVKLTFAFARGYISEPWSPKNIRALTRAWLLLGERLFQFICRLVKPRDPKSTTPFVALLVWVPRTAVI